jgi:NTE family protein
MVLQIRMIRNYIFSTVLVFGLVSPTAQAQVQTVLTAQKRPVIALALGGGAARGFAHIGVLAVLERAGIVPDLVVGTSAGSLVGALYASGLGPAKLREIGLQMDESSLGDWGFAGRSVVRGRAIQDYVNRQVANRPIDRFPRRFVAVATDLYSGEAKLFSSGDAGLAVRASSAVPTIIEPVRIADREYVDGGLVSPIPVQIARQLGATFVIAVDISSRPGFQETETLPQVLLQTFAIMGQRLGQYELKSADVAIRPELGDLGAASFSARQQSIAAGEEAAKLALPELLRLLGIARRSAERSAQ